MDEDSMLNVTLDGVHDQFMLPSLSLLSSQLGVKEQMKYSLLFRLVPRRLIHLSVKP